jgi:LCP family protein required for cell wall assembly
MQRASAAIIGIAILVLAVVIGFLLLSGPPDEPAASASVQASGTSAPAPSGSLAAELTDRRWTVLYVGTDANERRESEGEPTNADALMLVSLSADQSQLTLVSLPRDTVDVPLADGGAHDGKINSLARERDMDVLVGAMETLYGVPIDAHLALDMDDFARLVEAAGGVEVSPETALADPIVDLDLGAGPQTLDASQTLGYVRTRVDEDYGRMARQQEVIVALVQRLVDPETDVDIGSLIDGLDSLETDLPLDQLSTLVELARRAGDAEVTELVIGPPLITFEGDRDDGRGYVLEADFDAIRAEVQGLIGD